MKKRPKKKPPAEPPRLVVKLTERRKDKYERAADVADLSLSEWVRRVLDAAADKLLQDDST